MFDVDAAEYLKGVLAKVGLDIPPEDSPLVESLDNVPEHLVEAVNDLIYHLDRSVMLHVVNIPQPSWVICFFKLPCSRVM